MLNILREPKVFNGLSEDHLNLISTCGNLVTFVKGETIIREGPQGHPLLVIIKGQVEKLFCQSRKAARPLKGLQG